MEIPPIASGISPVGAGGTSSEATVEGTGLPKLSTLTFQAA